MPALGGLSFDDESPAHAVPNRASVGVGPRLEAKSLTFPKICK